ncbi:MAG: tetratricopeptide repeat protein [Ginsengibacter sp.]
MHKLNNAQNDSIKARTVLDIGEAIEVESPEKSLVYYQQALELSKQIKNNRLILSSTVDVGIAYIESNDLDKALAYLLTAIPVAKQVNDTGKIAAVLCNIGNVHLHKKDPVKAISYYLQATALLEKSSDKGRLPALYANICSLLNDQKEFDKAIAFGNKAAELAEQSDNYYAAADALINLSNSYGYLKNLQKQYTLLLKALPLAMKNNDPEQIATVYNNIGDYYYQQKQYQSSLNNYLESHNYVLQMGNKYHLCTSYSMLALLYNKLNQNDKALQYIVEAESLADSVGARANKKEIYLTRAEIEEQRGNFKIAYDYLYKSSEIKDSLFKVETSEKVADIEARYENEKKQKEILQLQKDKQIQDLSLKQKSTLNYFLFGSVAALLIVGFLGYRNFRHRQQLAKQREELHQQQIRELEKDKQLVAVDSMLKGQEDERSRLAKDLHDGLGGLLSGVKFSLSNMKDNLIITPDNMTVFERSLDMIDTSIKELRRVAHNMMPEMLVKFGLDEGLKEYCISINTTKLLTVKYQSLGMEERIDKSIEIIIYRIIQELLNNIMKHAAATEAFVQLIREGARLNVVVEDNGKGFETSLTENKGAGLENVRSRVDYLKGQLDIHSEPGKGTLVNIEFNIW